MVRYAESFTADHCLLGNEYTTDAQFLGVAFNAYLKDRKKDAITSRDFNKILLGKHTQVTKVLRNGRNIFLGITKKDKVQTIAPPTTKVVYETEEQRKEGRRLANQRYYINHQVERTTRDRGVEGPPSIPEHLNTISGVSTPMVTVPLVTVPTMQAPGLHTARQTSVSEGDPGRSNIIQQNRVTIIPTKYAHLTWPDQLPPGFGTSGICPTMPVIRTLTPPQSPVKTVRLKLKVKTCP